MKTKRTLLLALILAISLIIGIFIFSTGIQFLWQSENESENNIQINSNTTLSEISNSYPYESIVNSKEHITPFIDREYFFQSIVSGTDGMASLQEASNKMGELINSVYKPTSLVPPVAYLDYHKLNYSNSQTHIYYFTEVEIGENSFIVHAVLNSLTLEIISCTAFINQPISETAILTESELTPTTGELPDDVTEKVMNTARETLPYIGYNEEIEVVYIGYNHISIMENDVPTGKLMVVYSVSIQTSTGETLGLQFSADEQDLTLLHFYVYA